MILQIYRTLKLIRQCSINLYSKRVSQSFFSRDTSKTSNFGGVTLFFFTQAIFLQNLLFDLLNLFMLLYVSRYPKKERKKLWVKLSMLFFLRHTLMLCIAVSLFEGLKLIIKPFPNCSFTKSNSVHLFFLFGHQTPLLILL